MFGNSVQTRYLVIAAPIALVAILAVATWNAGTIYDKQVSRLDEKLHRLIQNQTIVMAQALADRDTRLLKLISASLVADPDIVHVHISDETGKSISELGQVASEGTQIGKQINVHRNGELVNGGNLTIGISYRAAHETFLQSLVGSAISAFLAICAIWLGGFLAFRYTVGRPIESLHFLIECWRKNQWVEPSRPLPRDEFGSLTSAFVELHKIIQKRERELRSIKEDLEFRVAERTEELRQQALTDSLTGLANRRAAVEFAQTALEQTSADGTAIAVFAIDLDHFKQLNDLHGHAIGDRMLCHAARQIEECLGSEALVARMGGDEFVAILPYLEGDMSHLNGTAQKIIKRLSLPVTIETTGCQIGASIGIAWEKVGGTSFEKLLANADLALYDAKKDGRGTARWFNKKIHSTYRTQRNLADDVRRAIQHREFEPFFQPQLALKSNEIVGFELLARWRREAEHVWLPGDFLPVIKDGGFSSELDLMILEKGLDALVELNRAGSSHLKVSSNASTASLQHPEYADLVVSAIKDRGLSPKNLVIEILEETMIRDPDSQALKTVRNLKDAGIGIELDDFGAGYSSLSQLAMLPMCGLKLDRSLVSPLPGGPNEEIVRAILALGKELDVSIVAEGIETQQQFSLLQQMGCDVAQGFLISHPMSFEETLALHRAREASDLPRLQLTDAQDPMASASGGTTAAIAM